MKIVFMGTPDFAVPSLEALARSGHSVVAVVTAPDKPRGRGRHLSFTPVKTAALARGIPVLQPDSLKDEGFAGALTDLAADLFVVVAFRILPVSVFAIPPLGTFNLHASLLPRYRGAAPINWALINGDSESGVTTFFIREKVDTGNILLQRAVSMPEDMNAGELHDLLSGLGAELVVKTVDMIAADEVLPSRQDDTLATPAPKIFRETCRIDWTQPARSVHNLVRGLSPYPAAWTMHGDRVVKVHRTRVIDTESGQLPGAILSDRTTIRVACGSGAVEVLELQQEGRRVLSTEEFLRGYSIGPGESFH